MINAAKILLASICLLAACTSAPPISENFEASRGALRFTNGFWYERGEFTSADKYVESGVFVKSPKGAVQTIDLGGAYIVPPFAEAHHHTVLCNPERIEQFTAAGIFYVQILNARISQKKCEQEMHNQIDAPEIANAYAGLTASESHPVQIGEFFLDPDEVDGEWVHIIDTPADLDQKWGAIKAMDADILKIFLSYTEEYKSLRQDGDVSRFYKGLDPQIVGPIVDKAHSENLRVAAHVMSAHDFKIAVEAGVDQIAHMPGFAPGPGLTLEFDNARLVSLMDDPARYLISRADAELAAREGVKVVTTLSGTDEIFANRSAVVEQIGAAFSSPEAAQEMLDRWINVWRDAAAHNTNILREAGVEMLIGSDRGEFNAVDEAVFLVDQKLMTASEALYSLSVLTPQAIFPEREIGELRPDAEASFIVLGADPLKNINAVREIEFAYKKGVRLE